MTSNKIGFIDYRLDNFHADVYLRAIRGPLAERQFVVGGATGIVAEPCTKWCHDNDVPYFPTVAQLAPHVDCFLVLRRRIRKRICRFANRRFLSKRPHLSTRHLPPTQNRQPGSLRWRIIGMSPCRQHPRCGIPMCNVPCDSSSGHCDTCR